MNTDNRRSRGTARSIQLSKKGLQLSLLAMALQSTSWAQNATWQGATNDWNDPANWSGGTVPSLGDTGSVFVKTPIPFAQPVISQPGAQANNLYVGTLGGSFLSIQDGGSLTANSLILGNSTNNGGAPNITQESGTVTVAGSSSTLTTGGLTVGYYGTGTLEVTNGGSVVANTNVILGSFNNGTSHGTINVIGDGSTFTSQDLNIGGAGEGTFLVSDRATATTSSASIGNHAGAVGNATVQGDETSWTVTQNNMTVGHSGTGDLTVADGAVVTIEEGALRIGWAATGVGHVEITGADSQISSQGTTGIDYMAIGNSGKGTLVVGDGGSVEAHATILGFNSIGNGTLTLDGAGTESRSNNYTTVGHLGKGVATVSNGATLRDDGTGGIRIGFGTGSTGVLNIGAAAGQAATGAGNIVANGGISFGDGTGTLVLNHTDTDYVLAPGITGTGNIDVLAGRTTLQGDSSGFDGQTSIQGGQVLLTGKLGGSMQIGANGLLQVGDGVTNGDLTADTVNDGTLIFDQVGNYDYTGALSGSGGLVKRGDGTLTLSGDYQYQGTTAVQGGIVSLAAQLDPNTDLLIDGGTFDLAGKTQTVAGLAGNSGELALGATGNLTVKQNQDSRFGGVLSGAGTFNKAGTASLDLTGVSSFNGMVNVDSGRLLVNGELPATIIVHDQSVLGGSGTAGAVIVRQGGTMAPGNSIGTLRVNGNVQFDAGSVYAVEVDAAGNSDRIEATGSALIDGGTVQVLAEAGNYSPATRYLILDAAGGVTGQFDDAVSNFAFLDPSLVYDANTVTLALVRNDTSFTQVAQTPNQRATAGALQSAFAAGSPVNQALVTSTAEQARQAFDALSGEVHASTLSAMAQQSEALRRTALDRLNVDAKGPQLWVQATGGLAHLSGNGNSASVRVRDAGGLSLGVDTDLGPARVGVAASYATSDVKVDNRRSSADTEALSASVYAGMRVGAVAVRAGASYSDLDFKTSRNVALGALSEHLSAKYGGKATTLFGEVGYPLQLAGGHVVEPFVGMNALWLKNDAFDEDGGSLALHGESRSRDYSWSTLGVKGSFALGKNRPVMISATVGWQHALSSRDVESRLAFAQGGSAYTIQGAPLAKDAALLGLDVDWQLSPATQVGIGYSGSLANQGSSHAAQAVLRTRF